MTEFFKRMEIHFRFTWEALVSNRLVIHLLSSGSAMYDMVLRQYLHYYQNYDVTLDHFLTGLNALGTGRLTFQVLDPDELDHFLSIIRRQLREERSPFELAFNHTYCRAMKTKGMVFRYTWVYSKKDTMAHTHRLVVIS